MLRGLYLPSSKIRKMMSPDGQLLVRLQFRDFATMFKPKLEEQQTELSYVAFCSRLLNLEKAAIKIKLQMQKFHLNVFKPHPINNHL